MNKKFPLMIFILIISMISPLISQFGTYNIPHYMISDFYLKVPDYQRFRIGEKVKYLPVDEKLLAKKPEQYKFLSSDGIETINISGAIWKNAQTETWISIDYNNPNNIIATSNDNAYLGGDDSWRMSSFVTNDGGKTWFHSPTPRNYAQHFTPKSNRATIFDPALAHDTKGNAYYAYGYCETFYDDKEGTKNKNGVYVVKSTDAGKTWNGFTEDEGPNGIVAITWDAVAEDGNPFHDRYTMTADRSPDSKYKDNIYIAWRVFRGTDGIVVSTSNDGGSTWTKYRKIANGGQHVMPITGPNGELYLTWTESTSFSQTSAHFCRSTDGGVSFTSPYSAQVVYNIGVRDPDNGRLTLNEKQNIRVSSNPQIAVDNSSSQYRGSIYIVQAGRETSGGNYGLYLAISRNNGLNFEKKNIRIDGNSMRNDIFFPSITVDPVTGYIGVFYYSSENDPDNVGVDGYFALSKDGGNTWKNLRITAETKYLNTVSTVMPQGLAGGVYWGDYTSITSYNGTFYPLFWMPTIGNAYYSNDLFTATLSDNPQPPLNSEFKTVTSPQLGAKLTWIHPTKNLFGEELGAFKIVIFKGSTKIGEVTNQQTPEFIDNNVNYGDTYNYHLYTELQNGQMSSIVDITALIGGNPKPQAPTEFDWRPTDEGIAISWRNPSKNIENQDITDRLILRVYDLDNNTVLSTIEDVSITAGNKSNYILKVPTNKFYKIRIKSVGVRGTMMTESDFSTEEYIAYSGAPADGLNENFDDANALTPSYKTGLWQLSTETSKSSPNSLADGPAGDYEKNVNQYYLLQPTKVDNNKKTFSFDSKVLLNTFVSANSSDIGEIAISNDFTKTWKILKWLDINTNSESFISGDIANSKFENFAYDISEYIGDTVMIRFRMSTNGVREDEGWFIDNITMDQRPSSINNNDMFDDSFEASISPNPSNGFAKINIKVINDANVSWNIYNSIGTKIASQNPFVMGQGNKMFDLNLADQPNGIYYVSLKINNKFKTLLINLIK